jgi:hypothetical protein
MKNIFKYSLALLTVVLGFASCDSEKDENYQPAVASGAQVYFANDLANTVNLTFSDTKFSVPVSRANKGEAVTVNITKEDADGLFTVPTSVSFAAGEDQANIEIGLDPTKFEYNDFKTLTLSIDPTMATPYGIASITLKVGMPLTYKSLGMGTYVDNWAGYTGSVEVQQCEQNPNSFRLVKPYADFDGGEDFVMEGEMDPYLYFDILQKGEERGGVTITQDDLIYFPIYFTGMIIPDYGVNVEIDHPAEFTSLRSEDKWLFNKVVEYQENGLPAKIQLAPYYYMEGLGGWNNTQYDGVIEFYFPGNEPLDYDVSVEYLGAFINADNEPFVQIDVEVGSDLDEAKILVAEGAPSNEMLMGIITGTLETTTVTKSGVYSLPCNLNGDLTVMIVGFGGGEAQTYDYDQFSFKYGTGSGQESAGARLKNKKISQFGVRRASFAKVIK